MVRQYTPEDYEMIAKWFLAHNEPVPTPDMLPPESTFVALDDTGTPHYIVTVYLLNTTQFCMVDNFARNPSLPPDKARVANLLKYIQGFARARGIQSLFCMAYRPALKGYYQEIGFAQTLDNVATYIMGV